MEYTYEFLKKAPNTSGKSWIFSRRSALFWARLWGRLPRRWKTRW